MHDASSLHYDFRLELDGVLKSWAVAKGPSLVPGEKRLAIHVEDHPLDYAGFEGTIPEGEYGGGTVMLWDRGTWIPEGDAHGGYAKGRLSFELKGKKLRGGWHLVRMRRKPGERQESWLLIKADDAFAHSPGDEDILDKETLSVKTGRTLEQIAGGRRRMAKAETSREGAGAPAKAPARARSRKAGASTSAKAPKGRKGDTDAKRADAVEVAGVRLTHPDRVLWDEQGVTKQGLAEFYVGIAKWLLPHVVGRPLALVRCPSGSEKGCFFQKHAWAGLSDAITREKVRDEQGEEEVLLVRDIAGVVALVQAGVLEIHPWGAALDDIDRPDRITFDFDPGEGVPWRAVVEGAVELRDRLEALGMASFAKTTGGKGLHVVVPLVPKAGWEDAKSFAKGLAEEMAADHPDRYLSRAAKNERGGKIFIDYLRNARGATAVAAYSTRARPGAPVSTPLGWDEVTERIRSDEFTVANLGARLERLERDPWEGFFEARQALPVEKAAARRPRRGR
jgi:bifunctional non-homologous end joining protein LigD